MVYDMMAVDRAQTVLRYWNWALSSAMTRPCSGPSARATKRRSTSCHRRSAPPCWPSQNDFR